MNLKRYHVVMCLKHSYIPMYIKHANAKSFLFKKNAAAFYEYLVDFIELNELQHYKTVLLKSKFTNKYNRYMYLQADHFTHLNDS